MPPRVSASFLAASTSATMRRARLRVQAAQRVGVDPLGVVRASARRPGLTATDAELDHVRDDLDAERLPEQGLGDRADGDAGRGLAGAGPLQDRPGVGVAVLLHAGQVGVAGPGPGQRGVAGLRGQHVRVDRVGRHHGLPLGPLASCRPGSRPGCPGSRRGGRRRGSRPRPARTPSARPGRSRAGGGPAPRAICAGHLDPGRHPVEDGDQRRSVRFPCRQPTQHLISLSCPPKITASAIMSRCDLHGGSWLALRFSRLLSVATGCASPPPTCRTTPSGRPPAPLFKSAPSRSSPPPARCR